MPLEVVGGVDDALLLVMVLVKLTILVNKVHFRGIAGYFCPNMLMGVVKTGEKEILLAHQK